MSSKKPHKLPSARLSLAVQYASKAQFMPTRPQLRRWAKAAAQRDMRMTLRIVDEEEGRELNRKYRGKDYATNVLTFTYGDEGGQPQRGDEGIHVTREAAGRQLPQSAGCASNVSLPPLTGDVAICAPVVEKEAAEQRKDLLAHYAHLAIHAVLHLQGYEHENEADAAEMEALEAALMVKLRYPDPYQATRIANG